MKKAPSQILSMFQKACNALSVLAFLLSASLAGGSLYGYLWITNEKNQEEIKQKVMEQVKGAIPIPSLSGPALPTGALSPKQQQAEKGKASGVPFNPF